MAGGGGVLEQQPTDAAGGSGDGSEPWPRHQVAPPTSEEPGRRGVVAWNM